MVFLTLDVTLVGRRQSCFLSPKFIAILFFERDSFRREFLEINDIERPPITYTVRASPKNESF
jgi:hypothetical protein